MNIQINGVGKKEKKVEKTNPELLGTKKSLISILCLSLFAVLIQSFIQNGVFDWMPFLYILYPPVVLLNTLPVFLVIAAFYYATGRIWIGCTAAYIPLVLLNLANYFKTVFRDDPLKLSDLQLIGEMNNITKGYELKPTFSIVFACILAIAAIIYAAVKCKSLKQKTPVRIIGAAVAVCIMILSYITVYTNPRVYNDIPTFAEEYHDTSMARHHGMLLTLLSSGNATKYDKPEGYTDEYAKQLLEESVTASAEVGEKEKINVIAIMGEAFFDVRRGGKAEFVDGKEPYGNWDEIKSQGYSGKLVVPGYGGSTESTEFEFLTGANLYFINSAMPTAYKTYITQPVYSLVQYFKDNGYYASALHPGYPWFYNRKGAYEKLGFDKFTSRDDMSWDTPEYNGYIKDEITTEWIVNEYTDFVESNPDTPYFGFTVTIENHGPYEDSENNEQEIFLRPKSMSDTNYTIINNYLNGVDHTDMLLGEICAFAQTRQEPVAVLFFGDHLPFFDEELECYEDLGYSVLFDTDQGKKNKHTVEYVMWCNDAAKEVIGDVKRGEGPEISSNLLGNELLNYLGVEKPPFYNFLDKVKKTANVISPRYFMMNGRYVDNFQDEIDEDERKILRDYKCLQYYNLRRYAKVDKD